MDDLLEDLAPMQLTFLVDDDTILVTELSIDMTALMTDFYENLHVLAANHGNPSHWRIL